MRAVDLFSSLQEQTCFELKADKMFLCEEFANLYILKHYFKNLSHPTAIVICLSL